MIQIKPNNLAQISVDYFKQIDKRIKKRLLKFEDVLESVYQINGKNVQKYAVLSVREWAGIRKILNSLPGVKFESQKDLLSWSATPKLTSNQRHIEGIIAYLKIHKNRELIILSSPSNHEQVIKDHYANMGIKGPNKKISEKILSKILDYKLITKKIAYDLTWNLNIRTCPYCNRIWINTVKISQQGLIRPALDHFYSQKKYPLLSLCFYNLVPSCYNCNTYLKNVKKFRVSTHAHPYIEGFDKDVVFSFTMKGLKPSLSHPDNFTITFTPNKNLDAKRRVRLLGNKKKDVGNIPTFKLEAIYQVHRDLLGEIYTRTDETSEFYISSIKSFLSQLGASKEEFYRFHFHNYYEDELMNMRPLSKFTRDIVLERIPGLRP